jgi:YVTN family beta-propeller protein
MKRWHLVIATVLLAALAIEAQEPPRHSKLYVLNADQDSMSIFDVATHSLIKTIRVGKNPHGIASNKAQTRVYVSTEGDRGLTIVDSVRDVAIKRYTVFGLRPNEIDVTPDGRFVYIPVLNDGRYEVFDTTKEEIVARIATDGWPHNAVVSPDGRYAYLMPDTRPVEMSAEAASSAGLPASINKNVYVVDTSTQNVIANIPLPNTPRPTAISPDGKRLYLNTNNLNGFLVVDLEARKVVSQAVATETAEDAVALKNRPPRWPSELRSHGIAVAAGGREVWSTDNVLQFVYAFDVTVDPPRQIARLRTGRGSGWATATPDGKIVYVSVPSENAIAVYDVASKTERARIKFEPGMSPKRMLVVEAPRNETTTAAQVR